MRSENDLNVVLETPWDVMNSWWTTSYAKRGWGVINHQKIIWKYAVKGDLTKDVMEENNIVTEHLILI